MSQFSSRVQPHISRQIAFKTFVEVEFVPRFKKDTDIELGAHIGIDQGTVLVRRIGLKRRDNRTDRQNEVWVGKPVNMSCKLASMAQAGELLVSDRYFRRIKHELVRTFYCGCPSKKKGKVWTKVELQDSRFDFKTAYCLKMRWCKTDGGQHCHAIIALDASAKADTR